MSIVDIIGSLRVVLIEAESNNDEEFEDVDDGADHFGVEEVQPCCVVLN